MVPTVPLGGIPPGSSVTHTSAHPFPLGLSVLRQLFDPLFTSFRPSLTLRTSEIGGQRGPSGGRFVVSPDWNESKARRHGSPTITRLPTTPPGGGPPGPSTASSSRPVFTPSVSVPRQPLTRLLALFRTSFALRFSEVSGQRGPPGCRFGVCPGWDESKVRVHGNPTITWLPTVPCGGVPP